MYEEACLERGTACRRQARSRPATPTGASGPEIPTANVRVVCRIRPMNDKEKKAGATPAATASTERKEVAVVRILAGGTRQVRSTFHFDDVLTSFSSQEDVFRATLQPLVGQVLAGYETTAFAYGQTGTGKTYTMEGQLDSVEGRGLVPRTASAVLEALATSEFTESSVTVSYLEIYNEELSDLLACSDRHQKLDLKDVGGGRGVCCQGLSEVEVHSMEDILEVVRRAQEKRRVAETRVNARSSRSHSIFTMKVKCQRAVAGGELENQGKLHLVDLAGSECAKKGGLIYSEDVSAAARMLAGQEEERERRSINQSLLTLGRVITALREDRMLPERRWQGSGRVPYRDSKLTRLLQDALGGRCKTVIIATISPALASVEETISALSYAEQAAGIRNRPVASSLLRTATVSAQQRSVKSHADVSSNSGLGASEWAELEMKVTYLSQELEEAQVALGRKYQEAQEEAERAHRAEVRLDQTISELRKVQLSCEEQTFAKQRFASLAAGRHEAVMSLQNSLATMDRHRVSLEKHLQSAKDQHRTSQSRASEFCQQLQQQLPEKVQPLEDPRVEEKISQMTSIQSATLGELQQDQGQQCENLTALTSKLQTHRGVRNETVGQACTEAKTEILENLSQTTATLQSIEAALCSAQRVSTAASSSAAQRADGAAAAFAAAAQRLRQRVASQRQRLDETGQRSRAALRAAEEAVVELTEVSKESLKEALEVVDQLEQMQMEVLKEMKEEANQGAGNVEAAAASGTEAVELERRHAAQTAEHAQKRWDSVTEALLEHAKEEEVLLQEAQQASQQIQQASAQRIATCAEKTQETQGDAVGAVQALRQGAVKALQEQCEEMHDFVEGNKASILDKDIPLRPDSLVPELKLPPIPSEEQLLSEFQTSRQPMSSGLIQSVTAALRNSKQVLSPVQVSNIQEALKLLDLPLEDKPTWGSSATRGLFFVFEGLDRSGKSTQSKKLEEYLSKAGRSVKWMCFPNRKTPIGTAIDLYLRRQLELPDEAVHRLFSANRWEMAKSIVEDLRAGTTIICDRYAFSGMAYSAAKGLDFSWCQAPDRGLPCPDGIFFLHIDEKVGAARSNFGDERYENAEMQAKVRAQFKDPRLRANVHWKDVNGARDMEVIHAEIRSAVEVIRQEDQENRQRAIPRLWVK